jgi:hypothetical protein
VAGLFPSDELFPGSDIFPGGAGEGPTYRSLVLEDFPLLYWRLNESGNTEVEDRSGHGRPGEYRNEAALGAEGALAGDPDTGVSLDEAKASYVKGLTYDPFSGTKTFEIWAKRKAGSHEKEDVVFGGSNGGAAGVFAYIREGTDNIRLTLNGFGTTATWEHAWPADEAWVHLVFVVVPGGKATLYVNGVDKGGKTVSAYGGTAGNVRISHDNVVGSIKGAFPGSLDEFAIYEGALPAERIAVHYEAGTRMPAEPASRCLWGADMDGDVALLEGEPKPRGDAPYDKTTWDLFEAHAGRPVGIVHFSDQWKEGVGPVWDGFGAGASDNVRARGAIPMKTIGGPANVLTDVVAGVYEDGLIAWAEAAAAFGDAVLLRPWWEFNLSEGTWAWSGSARAADHKAAWCHLHDIVKSIAPNVLFVWCPNVVVSGTPDLTAWWPGEEYVDWTAMDGYSGTNPAKSVGWRSAHKLFKPTYTHLLELAPDAPVAICETAASEIGGNKAIWIRNLLGEAIQEDMSQMRAFVWFNWNIDHGAGRVDWPMESSPAAQSAFRAGIDSSYYGNPLHLEAEPADLPLPTRAELLGQVDPGGLPAVYWFEYGADASYGSETPHRTLGPLGVQRQAAELLKGLKPGRTYHFRLVGENELGEVVTAGQSFSLARAPQLHVRELMPMDVTILATSPGGKTHRWAEDGSMAGKILEGMTDSGSVPGGNNKWAASLPRKLGVDYGDMKRGTRVEVFGAGQMPLSVYRLGRAPQVSGDKLVVSPDASGYEAHMLDDNTAQEIFLDADQNAWGETSARRRAEIPSNKYTNAQVQVLPAGAPDPEDPTSFSRVPAISHSWTSYDNSAGPDVAESWYDSLGVELGEILCDFEPIKGITPGDTTWADQIYASIDGIVLQELLADLDAATVTHKALSVPAGRFFLMLRDFFSGPKSEAANIETQWRNVRARGRNGLPLYGTWPEVGLLASDVVAFVLERWCPQIAFTTGVNGTIKPTRFIIPHLAFKAPTNAADMIQRATRFEQPEWGVWPTHRGPTFFMNPRGEREGRKRWRVRSHEAEFEETGQQMDLVWNGVMVEGQGTDNSTIFIGPPGSGLRYTTDRLLDTDPTNPVNESGGKRYAKIQMRGIATIAGMIEAGEAFLEHCRLLDASGRTTLTGYIEDDHGKRWPYYCAEAGDQIEWIGSSVPDFRYVVNADRTRSSRSVSIDIDAPPDSFEAMMERLNAEFVGVGVEGG